jgi:uncharacterized membrane protein
MGPFTENLLQGLKLVIPVFFILVMTGSACRKHLCNASIGSLIVVVHNATKSNIKMITMMMMMIIIIIIIQFLYINVLNKQPIGPQQKEHK